ncbi:MAG: DUF6335 family protein [Microcystaceae cyanobacterium]
MNENITLSSDPTGGDPDADLVQAEVVGEEAIGGTTPTPEQNVIDNIAASTGTQISDNTPVQLQNKLERRDDRRWELDPESSEDFQEREI